MDVARRQCYPAVMGLSTQTGGTAARTRRPPARVVLAPERLLDYADTCRRLARSWTALAQDRPFERAARLRRAAQAALHSACQAEELLALCGELGDGTPPGARPRATEPADD